MSQFNNYYGQQPYYGGAPAYNMQPQKKINCNNPLTKDQLALLANKSEQFSLGLTDLEIAKAICTHKKDGFMALVTDPNYPDRVTCTICGETFDITEGDTAAIEGACTLMKNIFQTLKTYWLDVPTEVAQNLYTIIPLLDKIPKIYNLAFNSFKKVDSMNKMSEANQPYGWNLFQNIMTPGMGMYQQPMMNQYQQPANMAFPGPIGGVQPQQPMMGYPQGYVPNPVMMPQQPMAAPYAPQAPVAPNENPFGVNAPVAPQAPTQAPAAQTTAPATAPTAVNEKVFSV